MDSLQKRILTLPQELQDLINSFNPGHRIMMRRVCREIEWTPCANMCGTTICRVDAFTIKRLNNIVYYCGRWCCIQDEDDYKDYSKRCYLPVWK